ncbi:MAG: hypothetical protein GX754_10980, partial [Clostridiaceae bacterium]|nr:hypothetical protein [Clostridiaceae bacterium]
PYTLEIYDAENRNIITSTALNISHIADIAYSEKNKTIYYLTSEDIGTIDPETGIVKTIRQLDFSNMKA